MEVRSLHHDTHVNRMKRVYELERVGQAQIVQCYADGFEQLSLKEKLFAYYCSLAAIAGRDIAIDQHHQRALEVRALFEEVFTHSIGVPPDILQKITTYLKLFWINNGFYDNINLKKFTPECSFEEFTSACLIAKSNGAAFNTTKGTVEQQLEELKAIIFDPNTDGTLTNKTPGEEWIKESAVNYYDRTLSLEEIELWAEQGHEQYPLNSTVKRNDGTLTEEIWRAGNGTLPPGKYADDLQIVTKYLEEAIPYASSEHQAETLRLLITFLKTGDQNDFHAYNIHWVKDNSPVDMILGFIEVYLDPRNQKGEWEGSVYFINQQQTQLMQKLATLAQYFEDKAPWNNEYKKNITHTPVANVVNAIIQTGGTGPVSPVGVNLPNEQAIRQQHGSKSILLYNVVEAAEYADRKELLKEFAHDEKEIFFQERYGLRADNLHTALHEVIGHGSGKMHPRLADKNPSECFPGYYSTLEEARADLVALWNAFDEKLIDIGIANDIAELRSIAKTMYQQAIRGTLTQLRLLEGHSQLEEDHMKARQLIGHYIIKHSDAVRIERRNNNTYYHIVDYKSARQCVGELLAEVMRIKAEGDLPAAKLLIDTYGLHVNTGLRDEVCLRARPLNTPMYTGFVQPTLKPKTNAAGEIIDIEISYSLDFAKQMLEYSAFIKKEKAVQNAG